METQIEKIKRILRQEGKIDNFRCFTERISLRLGARIWDLEQEGWRFKTYKPESNPKNYVYEVEYDPEIKILGMPVILSDKVPAGTMTLTTPEQTKLFN